ncbi:MAG: LytR C-terminal domain-containing protein [Actinomycetes bacterium]
MAVAVVAGVVALLVQWRGSPTTSTEAPGPAIASPTFSLPSSPSTSPSPTTPVATTPARPAPTAVPTQARPSPPPTRVVAPLFVANNTREKGKAHRAAAKFQAGGWPISGTGNYRSRTIAETTVYYPPGDANAKAAAESLHRQYSSVRRVAPRFAGLPGNGLVVVLTADFSA